MVGGYQLDALPAAAVAPLSTFGSNRPGTALPQNESDGDRFRNALASQLMQAATPYSAIYETKAELSDALAEIEPEQLARIDSTSRAMEGLILETLLKQMWATLPESKLFGNGLDTKFYREMWLEEVAADVSSNGGGVGIASTVAWEMILRAQTEAAGAAENSLMPDSSEAAAL